MPTVPAAPRAPVLILGAGLCGLTLAYRLQQSGVAARVLEARDRAGGRVLTLLPAADGAPVELGATWLGRKHTHLTALLAELALGTFPQRRDAVALYEPDAHAAAQRVRLPPDPEPSHRIRGGTSALIRALVDRLAARTVSFGQRVAGVAGEADGLRVRTADGATFHAARVVSTLPPQLLVDSVAFAPPLPAALVTLARQTHTWMGDSIKVALTYREAFWRKPDSAGTAFSNAGPLTELYDHADAADERHALVGFCDPARHAESPAARRAAVLAQLRRLYGPAAGAPLTYTELVWRDEPHTARPGAPSLLPHQHNGHPAFRQPFLDGRFYLAGTETAPAHPGYLDGAVASAAWVAARLTEDVHA